MLCGCLVYLRLMKVFRDYTKFGSRNTIIALDSPGILRTLVVIDGQA